MEWNGKFYFEWPRYMGTVYEVDPAAIGLPSVVVLPGGKEMQLVERDEGNVEIYETSTRNRQAAPRFIAVRVFDTRYDSDPTFAGDWESLTRLINAAAAVNTLFSVQLTKEEFERLSANNEAEFEVLKKKLSPRAASLLDLVDFDGEKRVDLYRTGQCP